MNLIINEIFSSINGEVNPQHQGSLCTFVRLQGCNLKCKYPCDTQKAQDINSDNGISMTTSEVVSDIIKQGNINVTVTGGEPLIQKPALVELFKKLPNKYKVSIETNGSIPIPFNDFSRADWVIDYKLPDSGECHKMIPFNYKYLTSREIVKFVVSSEKDFKHAIQVIKNIKKSSSENCWIAFSPCSQKMTPEKLYELMQNKFLKNTGAILTLQLHKFIGVS
jgi:7-carboxy-7-deazaguanine synthase